MKVYVCGDTHIPIDIGKINTTFWEYQKYLCKDDILIILGDFGLLWEKEWSKEELYWAKWLTSKNFTVCFIDGNHENFDRINSLEDINFHGGRAGIAYSDKNGTIYHLKRGEIFTFENKKVFTFGGAESIDKEHRIENISWWKEEIPNYAECDYALENLKNNNNEVDFILTHTCPREIVKKMNIGGIKCSDFTTKFFDEINSRIFFKQWHFGHFHTSNHIDERYICHYNWSPLRII